MLDNSKKSKNVYKEEIRGYLSEDEYPLFCRRGEVFVEHGMEKL